MAAKKKKPTIGKSVKVTNKWINKMTKRGKLRKKDKQSRQLSQHQKRMIEMKKRRDEQLQDDLACARDARESDSDDEEALPLDMIDSDEEIFQRSNKRAKFESNFDDDNSEDIPRSFGNDDVSTSKLKHLLPIKTSTGRLIPLAIKNEVDPDEVNAEDLSEFKKPEQEEPLLNAAQLFAKRQHLLETSKQTIATLCRQIIETPQENVGKLKDLLKYAQGDVDPLIQMTVPKLATASLLEVFLDVIPSYHIREWTEKEETQKMKKETKQLHQFEETLVRNYKKYLQHLENLCHYYQGKKVRLTGFLVPPDLAESLALLGLKCFCRLLSEHPHFNYRANILKSTAPLMSHKTESVRTLICECAETVVITDKLGEASLDVVNVICQYVKDNPYKAHPRMLNVFLKLKIKEIEKTPEGKLSAKEKLLARKKKMALMSRREKKFQKRMEKLDVELKELEAEENKNTVLKLHTRIMNKIFTVYFRILKRMSRTTLLAPVLEGLSKFAHLINVEFFDDLIKSLMDLVHLGKQAVEECSKSSLAEFTINFLMATGAMKPTKQYNFCIIFVDDEMFKKQLTLCLECLNVMINQRRKQVPLHRVTAFVKRIMELVVTTNNTSYIVANLLSIRSFFLAHPKLDIMLDTESVGGGTYRKDSVDPDRANATVTNIIQELEVLTANEDISIRQLALHILNGMPSEGKYRIQNNISSKEPWVLFEQMNNKSQKSETLKSV